MSEINAAWHEKHRMPKKASLEERVKWHIAHARNCSCREMPDTIRAEILRQNRLRQRKRLARATS